MMYGRFCYVTDRKFGPSEFARLVEAWGEVGVTLSNPWNGMISKITAEGDQVETTQADLADAIRNRAPTTFQFWFSDDTDLVCSIYPLGKVGIVQKYSLNGLDARERDIVKTWAISYFAQRALVEEALLLVIDSYAATTEYDWDGFVEGRCAPPHRMPEIIGLCPPLEIQCDGAVQHVGSCSIFTNRAMAED